MMSVGYDMYLKLLEEAVLEEQGEGALKEPECTADLNITANIAKTYVTSGEQRMDLYRRMAAIRSQSDADDLLDEIVDRYGDPPKGVLNLIDVALLRARAAAAGIIRHDLHGRAGLCRRLGLLCRAGIQGPHLLCRGQAAAADGEAHQRRGRAENCAEISRKLCSRAFEQYGIWQSLMENSEFRHTFLIELPLQIPGRSAIMWITHDRVFSAKLPCSE